MSIDQGLSGRLRQQIGFIRAIDRLKTVLRQTRIMSGGRRENSAEHSWHLAMMTMVLSEEAERRINVTKTVKMALVHDIPETYAGDVFVYDVTGGDAKSDARKRRRKAEKEKKAARKIFGMLPPAQGREMFRLWREYEAGKSAEAQFLYALDRLGPLMSNYLNQGYAWKRNRVKAHRVMALNTAWGKYAVALGDYARNLIGRSMVRGFLKK